MENITMKLHKLLLSLSLLGISFASITGMEQPKPAQSEQIKPAMTIEEIKAQITEHLFVLKTGLKHSCKNPSLTPEQRIHEIVDLFLNNLNGLRYDPLFIQHTIPKAYFYLDRLLIKTLIKRFDELAATQTQGVGSVLRIIYNGWTGDIVLTDFYGQSFHVEIRNLIHKNIVHFAKDKDIFNDIWQIGGSDELFPKIVESIDKISHYALASIFEAKKNWRLAHEIVRLKQKNLFDPGMFEYQSKSIIALAEEITEKTEYSPTQRHLAKYSFEARDLEQKFNNNPQLKELYSSFLVKEKALNKNNFYTFVHGQRRELYFPEKLYTFLWSQRTKQSVDNFLFAHVKDLVETEDAKFEEDVLRKTIRIAGTQVDSDHPDKVDAQRRQMILFMNYAFFANSAVKGSSSSFYVYNNHNSPTGRKIKLSGDSSFSFLGYEWLYKKYSAEIDKLANDYAELSRFGNLLLIAVPKDSIKKYVYLAESGGMPRTINIQGIGQTSDINVIMETLNNNPEKMEETDKLEFCMIMTQHKGGLDPATGIQIHPFVSGLPEKVKELQIRETALFAKMKADIQDQEKEKSMNRAGIIAGHLWKSITG